VYLLTRIVRLPLTMAPYRFGSNGLVGSSSAGLAGIGEFHVACRGELLESGYLVDITVIDRAIRAVFPSRIAAALREEASNRSTLDVVRLLLEGSEELRKHLPAPLARLAFRSSPFLEVSLEFNAAARAASTTAASPTDSNNHTRPLAESALTMPNTVNTSTGAHPLVSASPRAVLRETFEFAASHRLHLSARSDGENRALFGKCNNPNGHGHNYRIAVAVEVDASAAPEARPSFATIEQIVEKEIMGRFDHKHLNLDCPEFAQTNPSVENIARVCFEVLSGPFAAAGGKLRDVEVWETDKTSCRYPSE